MLIKPKSYKDIAYEKIKENIITGNYKPNEVLNERDLSESFGISRTPIREAFQQLSYEGWIINEPYKKNVVREFTLDYIIQTQKVRSSLEILAVMECIDKLDDSDIEKLEKIVENQKKIIIEDNFNKYIQLDRKFHEYLYYLSGNTVLVKISKNLNDVIRYFGLIALNYPKRQERTINEHNAIIKALKNRDADGAKKAMEQHMTNTLNAIEYNYKK